MVIGDHGQDRVENTVNIVEKINELRIEKKTRYLLH